MTGYDYFFTDTSTPQIILGVLFYGLIAIVAWKERHKGSKYPQKRED